ncbi:MAG: serine protease, partial [Chloroflexota bacterium]|nr:serine protease [Chloroflexota bacterium]
MTEDLQRSDIGEQFADAVESVTPSVVTVHGRRRLPGTGIVLAVEDASAVIVTASHVVEREDNLAIYLSSGTAVGTKVPATLIGRDLSRDLAVLRAETTSLSPVSDRPRVPRVGTLVMAVGRPWAFTPQATLGTVNAVGQIHSRRAGGIQLIHTDVTMLPGFSGGPLIDGTGNVVGINTSGLLRMANITI